MSEAATTISQSEMAQMGQTIDNSNDDLDWDSVDEYDSSEDAEVSDSEDTIEAAPEENAEISEEEDVIDASEEEEEIEEKKEAIADEEQEEEAVEEKQAEAPSSFEVKVNGKVEEVTLDELKENYSGKVAYDKKFTEVDNKAKALEKQIDGINGYVTELGKTMKNSSVLEGVFKIGELNNIGPHYITKALIDELLPEINRLSDLSEDQRDLEFGQADLDYNKKLQEKQTADNGQKQAEQELQSQIGKVMDSLGTDNDEWNEAVEYLDKNLPRSEELTPEVVGEYIQFQRADSRAVSELNTFEGGAYANDETVYKALLEVVHTYPEFTSQDLQELLEQEYGAAKHEAAEQKVEEVSERKASKTKKNTNNNKKKNEDLMFSELDSDDWDDIL